MNKANKAALDWLPKRKDVRKRYYQCNDDDIRSIYAKGYRKAEKDLELSWQDIREIYSILLNVQGETSDDYLLTLSIPERIENEHREYKETLKRYFEWKNNKAVQQRIKTDNS